MLSEVEVDFTCGEPCRSVLEARILAITDYPAIPALLKKGHVGGPDSAWYVGLYDKRLVDGGALEGLIVKGSGIKFLLPQPWLIEDLHGKELVWVDEKFAVQTRG